MIPLHHYLVLDPDYLCFSYLLASFVTNLLAIDFLVVAIEPHQAIIKHLVIITVKLKMVIVEHLVVIVMQQVVQRDALKPPLFIK